MKKIYKSLLSLLLFGASFLCFYFPTKITTSIVYKHGIEKTITTEDDGIKQFFNYVGLFLLIMTIWIWRKEMKINQFGFIGSNGIEPTDPESLTENSTTPKTIPTELTKAFVSSTITGTDFQDFKHIDLKIKITEFFKTTPFSLTNATIIANTFSVSKQTVEIILFELMKENIVRRDTYPGTGRANYSLTTSLENLAIEDFIKSFITSEIISDNRFVRVNQRYELDAIIKTSKTNYVVEVKRMGTISLKRVDDAIKQLMKIEEQIRVSPIKLVLIIATHETYHRDKFSQYENIENLIIHFFKDDN